MISSLYQQGLTRDLSYLYKDVSRWAFTGALVFFLLTALLAKDIMSAVAVVAAYLARLFLPGYEGPVALVVLTPLFLTIFSAVLFVAGLSPSDRQFLSSFWSAVRRNLRRAEKE